jgi:hypothetical protein
MRSCRTLPTRTKWQRHTARTLAQCWCVPPSSECLNIGTIVTHSFRGASPAAVVPRQMPHSCHRCLSIGVTTGVHTLVGAPVQPTTLERRSAKKTLQMQPRASTCAQSPSVKARAANLAPTLTMAALVTSWLRPWRPFSPPRPPSSPLTIVSQRPRASWPQTPSRQGSLSTRRRTTACYPRQ